VWRARGRQFSSWLSRCIDQPLAQSPPPARYLNPVITLDDETFVLIVQSMAAVRAAALGPAVGNLSGHQDEITRAVDMVFQGF
jgi:toxin CcdB